jgi:hypothetical protein
LPIAEEMQHPTLLEFLLPENPVLDNRTHKT